jgi:hypothetical protein
MGWSFSLDCTRKELIAERIESHTDNEKGTSRICLAHCLRGNALWTVWEIITPEKQFRYIGCDLLQNGGKSMGWGYKDLDESMGPYQVSCPLSYLDMVPQPDGEIANNWRKAVRDYHAKRTQTQSLGTKAINLFKSIDHKNQKVVLTLNNRTSLKFGVMTNVVQWRKGARHNIMILADNDREYRCSPKFIESVTVEDRHINWASG